MDQDLNLTPRETAARLRCSTRTLARMRARKKGPGFFYHGAAVLYPLREVEAYIRSQMAFSCAETCENHK